MKQRYITYDLNRKQVGMRSKLRKLLNQSNTLNDRQKVDRHRRKLEIA